MFISPATGNRARRRSRRCEGRCGVVPDNGKSAFGPIGAETPTSAAKVAREGPESFVMAPANIAWPGSSVSTKARACRTSSFLLIQSRRETEASAAFLTQRVPNISKHLEENQGSLFCRCRSIGRDLRSLHGEGMLATPPRGSGHRSDPWLLLWSGRGDGNPDFHAGKAIPATVSREGLQQCLVNQMPLPIINERMDATVM